MGRRGIKTFMMAMLLLSTVVAGPAAPKGMIFLNTSGLSAAQTFAGLSCSGLLNRDPATPAYIANPGDDMTWLQLIYGITHPSLTSYNDFLATCLQGPAQGRYIRYSASTHAQQKLVPNIVTLAGVLDAVPLDVADPLPPHATTVAFDALSIFDQMTPLEATRYVFEHHVHQTTGMSKMNPGYESQAGKAVLRPNITGAVHIGLADYVVKERLFNFYLTEGCLPLTEEHALVERIVKNNPWPKPIGVMGYDETFALAGDLFEAETTCVTGMGMGQIASDGVVNLAYWSREPPLTQPLPHNDGPPVIYDHRRTYVAFLIGDGDNVAYLKHSRRDWITERLERCKSGNYTDKNAGGCSYPLLWTMSPHVTHLAPDWARWFAEQLLKTKTDGFALPPSGHLYSYPSLFPAAQQENFVRATENDCRLLATRVSTAWEVASSWEKALESFFPLYATRGIVQSLVTVNVPFDLPVLAFENKLFKVVGDDRAGANRSVVFAPHEWRGTGGGGGIPGAGAQNMNVTAMAAQINGYSPGAVTAVYLTSDGGGNLEIIDQLVKNLGSHVSIVGNEIGELALRAVAAGR